MEVGRNTIVVAFAVENLLAFIVAAAILIQKYRQRKKDEQ